MTQVGEAAYEAVLTRGNASPRKMESLLGVMLLGKGSEESTTDSTTSSSTDDKKAPQSQQLQGDPFSSMATGEFVPPRYNPTVWAMAMEQNTRLGRSIRTYARNTVGLGWFVEPVKQIGPDSSKELHKQVKEQMKILQDLFEQPNDKMPLTELFYMMKVDEEATGDGYLEVVRNNAGKIYQVHHIPAVTVRVRVRKTSEKKQEIGGFLQIRGNEKRYFKEFGDKRVMNAENGEFHTGHSVLATHLRATEIIHFRLYSPTSAWYGAPRYVSAAPAISGNRLAAIRNVKFFENDAPQPVDTPVLTPTGWCHMGDLKLGDQVIGSDGKGHTVLKIYEQGIQPVHRVRFTGGGTTECTLNHVWSVSNEYDRARGETRLKTLAQLIDEGFHYECGIAKWAVPLVNPVVYAKEEKPLAIDPYLLGLLLGDGSFRTGTRGSITLAAGDEDVAVLEPALAMVTPEGTEVVVRRRAAHGFVGSRDGHGEFRFRNIGGKQGSAYPNPLKTAIRELGLLNVKGDDKFIPETYLRSSVENRVALLQGLIDSDGCISETAIRYTTISKKLADDVCELAGSLGGIASACPVKNRSTYQVTIRKRFPEWLVPARLPRKVAKYSQRRVMPRTRTMLGAEFSREVQTRCIRVDADDGLYVTENFIVTHNTPRMALLVSGGRLTPESVQSIEDFFAGKVRGVERAHSVVVIQTEQTKIGFQHSTENTRLELRPLTVGVTEDASFETYRKSNDEEIREAFGIASVFYTAENVNKSSAQVGRELTNEQEFEPDRLEKEYIINQRLIPDILGDHPLVNFRFERMKLTDPLDNARMEQTYAGLGALTPNELRASIGKPPYPKDYKFADKPMQVAMAELSMQMVEAIIGEFKSQITHQVDQAKAQQQASGMGGMLGGAPGGAAPGGAAPGGAAPEEGAPAGEEAKPLGDEGGIAEWSEEGSTEESSPVSEESTESKESPETEEDSHVRRIHNALGLRKNGETFRHQLPVDSLLRIATELMSDARKASKTALPDLVQEDRR